MTQASVSMNNKRRLAKLVSLNRKSAESKVQFINHKSQKITKRDYQMWLKIEDISLKKGVYSCWLFW